MNIDQAIELALRHQNAGQFSQAEAIYRQVLHAHPDHPQALHLLGVLAIHVGQPQVAATLIRQAIAAQPGVAIYHHNLGTALKELGQFDQAIAAFNAALAINPMQAETHAGLADSLCQAGDFERAISVARHAIELNPRLAQPRQTLGDTLALLKRRDEAIAAYRDALALDPGLAVSHANLSTLLESAGQIDAAAAAARRAVELDPKLAEAHNALANTLVDQADIGAALDSYRYAVELKPSDPLMHSNLICAMHLAPGLAESAILEELTRWDQRHAQPLAKFHRPHLNNRDPARRPLRVGYVATDFRDHCQVLFSIPLFANHDRSEVELYCYGHVAAPDSYTARIQSLTPNWRNIAGMSDQAAAEVIRNDRIDILVDLTVHTSNNRLPLFTWKPAPIQVTYLGSPMSTGLRAMDYRISDPHLDLPDVASIWPERIVRLPETFWCYDPLTDQPPVNPLPALAGKPLTFGCLNKFAKVNRHVLELWARVLLAAPNSRLILLADPGSHRDRTISVFAEAGVEPDRIQFESRRSRADYMRLYHNLDIALDTFPYNGHTTSLDALWMGVPVVSLVGRLPVSRAGLSLATNIGLPEFAVDSSEAFVARALDLANDLPKLAELRSTLRARMQASPLMDSRRFVRSMEAIFREIWRQWCCGDAGNPPR